MSNPNYSTPTRQEAKPRLYIRSGASRGLKFLYNIWKIVFVIIPFALGVILLLFGFVDEHGHIGIYWGLTLIISSLVSLLWLQVWNSLVVRTRAAEYYIAEMEEKYEIRG
jgi:tetrahydromethanopterin S-methyltransferase subunit E